MLQLLNIKKDYIAGDTTVTALKGVDLCFRKNEFVSIVGPSGCGKTTLLNIVGGLDKYTEGDLIINGVSTKDFRDIDWDAYRNRSIGFVFQSYNLIPHLTVLGNVELALTLSGVSKSQRKQAATDALERVGLGEQINKKPNQLSGGQMQRVSIARAIVNKPDIILADEPTGALDSETSVQIMDLLKELSADKLVIMVSHNLDLANKYSDRIISILDGRIIDDNNPYLLADEFAEREQEELQKTAQQVEQAVNGNVVSDKDANKATKKAHKERVKSKKKDFKKTSMSYFTAVTLSARNLWTKKTRTFLTAFAGSIGIIGIALVLSLSNGFSKYLADMQDSTLTELPIAISRYSLKTDLMNMSNMMGGQKDDTDYGTTVRPEDPTNEMYRLNRIDQDYVTYIKKLDSSLYKDIAYGRQVGVNIFYDDGATIKQVQSSSNPSDTTAIMTGGYLQEVSSNDDYLATQFKKLAGEFPKSANEVVIIVGSSNQIGKEVLSALGLSQTENFEANDLVGTKYKWIPNDDYYKNILGSWLPVVSNASLMRDAYNSENAFELKVVGVLKVNDEAMMPAYSEGLGYTSLLTQKIIEINTESAIGKAQLESKTKEVLTDRNFEDGYNQGVAVPADMLYNIACIRLGAMDLPTSINIYPKDFAAKEEITKYLDAYNTNKEEAAQITYTDYASLVTTTVNTMIDSMSIVLIVFAAISLVVSSIMIAIITYVSVIERTKEIGVLRSLGARKKDISRVFNAETITIGFGAGLLGVLLAAIFNLPINAIIKNMVPAIGGSDIALLNPLHALILVVLSVCLTLISGLIPAKMASKKDPVVALRTE